MKKKATTTVVIGARVSFLHCFKAFSFAGDGSNAKYMATPIIPKSDARTIQTIEDAINCAIEKGKEELWNGKIPPHLNIPLKDGDERENKENFENCYYIVAKSSRAPQVVDQKLKPLFSDEDIYSGCYVNISITFVPYSAGPNRGISALLGNIQLARKGEPFGGRARAEDQFKVIPYEDEAEDILEDSEDE